MRGEDFGKFEGDIRFKAKWLPMIRRSHGEEGAKAFAADLVHLIYGATLLGRVHDAIRDEVQTWNERAFELIGALETFWERNGTTLIGLPGGVEFEAKFEAYRAGVDAVWEGKEEALVKEGLVPPPSEPARDEGLVNALWEVERCLAPWPGSASIGETRAHVVFIRDALLRFVTELGADDAMDKMAEAVVDKIYDLGVRVGILTVRKDEWRDA